MIVKDFFAERFGPPTLDSSQDIKDVSLTNEDGFMILKFKKPLSASDTKVI